MKQLHLVCEASLKLSEAQDGSAKTGNIEARVTTWGPREGADGRRFFYKPEGFMDWAESFKKSDRPLPMFVNHAADAIPVGEWNTFEFDATGMTASGKLYTQTSQGSDLYKVMSESPNMFGGVSVGAFAEMYSMVDDDGEPALADDENAYFQITKGGLREVSVVMYPNNPEASVSKLEFFHADGAPDMKILERHLRDSGVSKSHAVIAAGVFKSVIEKRDAVKSPLGEVPSRSDSDEEAKAEILAALEQRELLKLLSQRINHVKGNHRKT